VVAACQEIGLRVAVLDLLQSIERHPPDANLVLAINAGKAGEVRHGFEQVKSAFGAIDVLVFLVGFALTPPRPTAEIDETQWTEVVHGNLTTAHLVTREALPLLREGNSPSIVTISWGWGFQCFGALAPMPRQKPGLSR
jgi:3-oxoacyl-[acyl-carrier protein] reductase